MSTLPSKFLKREGFTLTEVMIASAISTMVLIGLITFFVSTYSYWHGVTLRMDADSDVNIAMSRMIYGMGDRLGLRAAAVESVEITENGDDWIVNYDTGGANPQNNSFTYSATDQSIVFNPGALIVGRDVTIAEIGHPLDAQEEKIRAMLNITLRVEKEQGKLKASRELKTTVSFRNRRN